MPKSIQERVRAPGTTTGQSSSGRDQKLAELDKVFAEVRGPYDRFPHVSHILGSDWTSSVLPNGPSNPAHYREAAYRFLQMRWPAAKQQS